MLDSEKHDRFVEQVAVLGPILMAIGLWEGDLLPAVMVGALITGRTLGYLVTSVRQMRRAFDQAGGAPALHPGHPEGRT